MCHDSFFLVSRFRVTGDGEVQGIQARDFCSKVVAIVVGEFRGDIEGIEGLESLCGYVSCRKGRNFADCKYGAVVQVG